MRFGFNRKPQKGNLLNDDDILYFLHIPKTAGTTLITLLDMYFDSGSILKLHEWQELLPLMPIDFSKIRFIRGHFGYSMLRILPKKPVCITMLRRPNDLIISAYKMLQRQPEDAKRFVIPQDRSISDLILGPYLEGLKNPQTHWLVIEQDIVERTKNFTKNELSHYRPEEDEKLLPDYSYGKFLKIAKKHLSKFAFVGIVEKMEESLFLLHYTFGWNPIHNTIKENVDPVKQEPILSDEVMIKLSELIEVDNKLYDFGKKTFESRFSRMVKELKEKYYKQRFEKMKFNDMIYEMLKKDYFERKNID